MDDAIAQECAENECVLTIVVPRKGEVYLEDRRPLDFVVPPIVADHSRKRSIGMYVLKPGMVLSVYDGYGFATFRTAMGVGSSGVVMRAARVSGAIAPIE